jgi:Ser/Thr protein kinase RdoA (MazF antagonist)
LHSFERFSYQEQLVHLQKLAETILPQYGIHNVQPILLQYEDNAVYYISTSSKEQFILRINALEGHGMATQLSEMQWLMALQRDLGLRVPKPIPTLDGELVTVGEVAEVGTRLCVLLRWIPGTPPEVGIQPDVVGKIGEFTALLHNHAEHFVPPKGFVRPSWDWEDVFGALTTRLENTTVALAAHEKRILAHLSVQVQEDLSSLSTRTSFWGLIHADLHKDNILIDDGNVGVIDFDDCGWGYYLYDIASVFDSFYRRVANHPQEYLHLRDAYITGYERIRPLAGEATAYLRTFKAMRDMVTMNFILDSKNATVHEWGKQRIAQIIKQLEAYLEGSHSIGI